MCKSNVGRFNTAASLRRHFNAVDGESHRHGNKRDNSIIIISQERKGDFRVQMSRTIDYKLQKLLPIKAV